jgi:hypothetical protein
MRNIHSIAVVAFSVVAITISGCSSKDYALAPVAGMITHEGKPVSDLRVTFSPQPIGENYAVGPYSKGKTDSAGKFTLKTRYDEAGAVVGKHTLSFEYNDISETAMSDLREALADARDSGSEEELNLTKKKIAELNAKLKGRPVLKGKYEGVIDVAAGGTDDLKLELTEME